MTRMKRRIIHRSVLYGLLLSVFLRGVFSKVVYNCSSDVDSAFKNVIELGFAQNVSPARTGHVHRTENEDYNFQELLQDAEMVHTKLTPILSELYFRIFRVNLDAECAFRKRNDLCATVNPVGQIFATGPNGEDSSEGVGNKEGTTGNTIESNSQDVKTTEGGTHETKTSDGSGPQGGYAKCHVDRCNLSDIPVDLQAARMEHYVLRYSGDSQKEGWDPLDLYGNDVFYNDILGIHPSSSEEAPVFVDLLRNPPSFTGYYGTDDWKMMREEDSQDEDDPSEVPCQQSGHLHKLISGMQSCISATAAWNYECINPVEAYELQTDLPRYHSNEDFFNSKLGNHPDRLENLYYTFQTLLTATCRLFPVIAGFAKNCCSGDSNMELQSALYEFLNVRFISCQEFAVESEDTCDNVCCSSNKIQCLNHPLILEKFAKITKIVECVDCEKCRLHGKIKLTALQIAIRAFSKDTPQVLERNEIVALLHGLDYYAQAILIIQRFREKRKRQIMLYPIRIMLAVLVFLIVVYRKELYYAIFYCSLIEVVTDDHRPVVDYF